MIVALDAGVVFLAMPKCASTAVERVLKPHGHLIAQRNPLKHMNCRTWERFVLPLIGQSGVPRDRLEVVCLFREPTDWVHSWWRYRSRPELAAREGPSRKKYAGDVSFDEFARRCVANDGEMVPNGRQANFVRGLTNEVGVDRVFRYERMDVFADFLSSKLGTNVTFDQRNVSPSRDGELEEETLEMLQSHLKPEYDIYHERTEPAW